MGRSLGTGGYPAPGRVAGTKQAPSFSTPYWHRLWAAGAASSMYPAGQPCNSLSKHASQRSYKRILLQFNTLTEVLTQTSYPERMLTFTVAPSSCQCRHDRVLIGLHLGVWFYTLLKRQLLPLYHSSAARLQQQRKKFPSLVTE